jgi:hypothetical protein
MKSTLMIKDLSVSKELDGKAMAEVRGGSIFSAQGGLFQAVSQGNGVGTAIGSPNTNVGINAPVATNTEVDFTSLTNVLGRMNAGVFKA